ncbi:hypothetical protein HNQ62_003066, partial [Sulfurisphaera ohwakuensis]|nr:hypothetical protein [Sulfurisphaera ohwakuensis]
VVDTIDVDKEQIFNRMLKVYVKTNQSVEDKIWKAIYKSFVLRNAE